MLRKILRDFLPTRLEKKLLNALSIREFKELQKINEKNDSFDHFDHIQTDDEDFVYIQTGSQTNSSKELEEAGAPELFESIEAEQPLSKTEELIRRLEAAELTIALEAKNSANIQKPNSTKEDLFAKWQNAESLVGHASKPKSPKKDLLAQFEEVQLTEAKAPPASNDKAQAKKPKKTKKQRMEEHYQKWWQGDQSISSDEKFDSFEGSRSSLGIGTTYGLLLQNLNFRSTGEYQVPEVDLKALDDVKVQIPDVNISRQELEESLGVEPEFIPERRFTI